MPVTVHEFKADAIMILAKFMYNLFNFEIAPPECKRVQIMLKAQSQSPHKLVSQDADLYDCMLGYISKYNSELKKFQSEVSALALDALDTSNEGEYLKICNDIKDGYNKTVQMLDTLKDYDKIISAHLVVESNSIIVVIDE